MMYLEISEKLLNEVKKITGYDYKSKAELVTYEDIVSMIEDLTCEYGVLQEKYEDFERDLEDNYIHRPMSDYTGDVYDDNF